MCVSTKQIAGSDISVIGNSFLKLRDLFLRVSSALCNAQVSIVFQFMCHDVNFKLLLTNSPLAEFGLSILAHYQST